MTRDEYVALLRDHNRQRYKSAAEQVREELVDLDPAEAHGRLRRLRDRSVRTAESRGLQVLDIEGKPVGASVTVAAGSSRVEPGMTPAKDVTLSWATFSAAADEAGISRRYGGIHFVDADLVSRVIGRQVAAQAWEKARSYIDGTAGG